MSRDGIPAFRFLDDVLRYAHGPRGAPSRRKWQRSRMSNVSRAAAQPLGRWDGMDVGRRTTVTCDRESRWYNKAFAAQRSAWTPPVNNTYMYSDYSGQVRPCVVHSAQMTSSRGTRGAIR